MSKRAYLFLQTWAADNIHAEGYESEGDNSQARRRADEFMHAAMANGIPEAELMAIHGDIVEYLRSAIKEANDAEVERLAAKDD